MERIKERKEELKKDLAFTHCDCICDYSNGYICDVISEISDSHVDIYNYDLFEWCKTNFEWVNEWIAQCGTSNDIIRDIQGGQFMQNEQEIYNNLENTLLLFAYNHLYENEIALTDEQLEELEGDISTMDNNNRLEEIIDKINELANEESEEE